MKALIAALVLLAVLIGCIVTITLLGEARLTEYMELLPENDCPPEEGAAALHSLHERLDETLWFLNSFSHHDAADHLYQALGAATAAAESGDKTEYAIHLSELRAVLEDFERELSFSIKDFF